jgi:hypothetical protein
MQPYKQPASTFGESQRRPCGETALRRLYLTQALEVRYGSLADNRADMRDVRFTPNSGHAATP